MFFVRASCDDGVRPSSMREGCFPISRCKAGRCETHINIEGTEVRNQFVLLYGVATTHTCRNVGVFGPLVPRIEELSGVGIEQAQILDGKREALGAKNKGDG